MKVNSVKCSKNKEKLLDVIKQNTVKTDEQQHVEAEAYDCQSAIGRAQVAMQNRILSSRQDDSRVKEIINEIVKDRGMKVGRYFNDNHISIGKPIEGFSNLYSDDMRAKCIRTPDGFIDEIYLIDNLKKDVFVYKPDGTLKKHFTSIDMKSLFEYKYHPENIHRYLRQDKVYNEQTEKELKKQIDIIDSIFNDYKKVWKTDKNITLYRALQDKLTPSQVEALSTIGKVFKDSSFVSTTKELGIAKRFSRYNPILEIEVPKGSKYIDLDMLFNIDRKHWNEQEFLLPRNSMFMVTGFDEKSNIIKVKLI